MNDRSAKTDLNLFTYGTLVVPEVMQAVTGESYPSTTAVLEGYACRLIEGECFPGIAPASGGRTEGVLYLGLDRETMKLLDRFEGDLYVRKRVAVRSDPLGLLSAYTYVMAEGGADRLTDEAWDLDRFKSEHLEEWLEVCATFVREGKR